MEEDWDTLVILDACRYDLFEETVDFEGQLESRISPGSATPEFLTKTFEGRQYHDTVYVTANPMYRTRDLDGVFHHVVDVWKDYWDDERFTVGPQPMRSVTTDVHNQFPEKRIISHWMQPHYPFIGETEREVGPHSGFERAYRNVTSGKSTRDNPTIWERLERGDISKEIVWGAYKANLEIALPHVKKLHRSINGKTVATSDHGNLLGEKPMPLARPVYGHPSEVYHPGLNKVPWLILPFQSRRNIVSEDPTRGISGDSEGVKERLSELGYVDV